MSLKLKSSAGLFRRFGTRRHARRLSRPLVSEQLEDRRLLAVVTSLADSGAGSLRAALAAATPGETITFGGAATSGTITLTSGELLVNKGLTLDGAGQITVSGNNASRVFRVDDSLSTLANVTMRGLNVTGGRSASDGAGIYSKENLTLENLTISGNAAIGSSDGGGIAQTAGHLVVRNAILENNSAADDAAAVLFTSANNLTIEQGTRIRNNASGGANVQAATGAISILGGSNPTKTIRITDSFIESNTATSRASGWGGNGAGLYIKSGSLTPGWTTEIRNTTISGNIAQGDDFALGGGIRLDRAGNVLIEASIISDNTAQADSPSPNARGGGISVFATSELVIRDSLISGNEAVVTHPFSPTGPIGGGIALLSYSNQSSQAQSLLLDHTTVANNTTTTAPAAGSAGGGILIVGPFGNQLYDVDFQVTDSTISGNSSFSGGGVYARDGVNQNWLRSQIKENHAQYGAGLLVSNRYEHTHRVTMADSTISGNVASRGGGFYFASELASRLVVDLDQVTVSGNTASQVGGGILSYGDLYDGYAGGANIGMRRCTITDNDSGKGGGSYSLESTMLLNSSIVAGNTASLQGADIFKHNSSSLSAVTSLIGNNGFSGLAESPSHTIADAQGNLIGGPANGGTINALLGPLANNGGPTRTHALLPGSPAIDRGTPGLPASGNPPFDQRGASFYRVMDGNGDHILRQDMGAFEVQPASLPALIVDTLVDELDENIGPGDFSLREAITLANAWPGANVITFSPALTAVGPVTLLPDQLLPYISDSLVVQGPGSGLMTIGDASHEGKFFGGGTFASPISLSVTGLTLDHGGVRLEAILPLTLTDVVVLNSPGFSTFGPIKGAPVSGNGDVHLVNSVVRNSMVTGFVQASAVRASGNLTLENSVIEDNVSNTTFGNSTYGSAVFASASVSVRDTTISGNQNLVFVSGLSLGGGIHAGQDIVVERSTISNNTADFGGGIVGDGNVSISSSTVSDNVSSGNGGGILSAGNVSILSSTVSGNVSNGKGGGIYAATGTVLVDTSTVSGNTAAAGGGIYSGGNVNVMNSTVSGNSADTTGGISIFGNGNTLTVDHSTITENSAFFGSGGIRATQAGVVIRNSIVSGNNETDGLHDDIYTYLTTVQMAYSLLGDGYGSGLTEAPLGSPDANGNLIGGAMYGPISAQLAPLANNGGPTETHLLLPGSPASNAGDPAFTGPPLFDQRGAGFARVLDGRVDMGAVEVITGNAAPIVTLQGPTMATAGATLHYTFATLDPDSRAFDVLLTSGGLEGTKSNEQFDRQTGIGSFDVTFAAGFTYTRISVQVRDFDGDYSNVDSLDVFLIGGGGMLPPGALFGDAGGQQADDNLLLDFPNGFYYLNGVQHPLAGLSEITFDGGGGVNSIGVDGNQQNVVYETDPQDPSRGVIRAPGYTIRFVNMTPVDFDNVGTLTIAFAGANDQIDLENDFNTLVTSSGELPGQIPALKLSGTSGGVGFERAHVFRTNTIVIDTTDVDGDDTVVIHSGFFGHGNTNLSINTGNGNDSVTVAGQLGLSGTLDIRSAQVLFQANVFASQVDVSSGVTLTVPTGVTVSAADVNVAAAGALVLDGQLNGDLHNAGLFSGNSVVAGNYDGAGELIVGNGLGTFHVVGNFVSTGIVRMDVNGTVAGTDYDQIFVSANADITGATLIVTVGYVPAPTDVITLVTANVLVGPFINVAQNVSVGSGFYMDYTTNEARLLQTQVVDGDFNDDGLYDCADIDSLVGVIAAMTHDPAYDLTGDGLVNLLDRDAWLAVAGGVNLGSGRVYKLGDANLDGTVDGIDFIQWNAHKFTASSHWCDGDFSGDGFVDGLDFILWNGNKFSSSDASRGVSGDKARAASLVDADAIAATDRTTKITTGPNGVNGIPAGARPVVASVNLGSARMHRSQPTQEPRVEAIDAAFAAFV